MPTPRKLSIKFRYRATGPSETYWLKDSSGITEARDLIDRRRFWLATGPFIEYASISSADSDHDRQFLDVSDRFMFPTIQGSTFVPDEPNDFQAGVTYHFFTTLGRNAFRQFGLVPDNWIYGVSPVVSNFPPFMPNTAGPVLPTIVPTALLDANGQPVVDLSATSLTKVQRSLLNAIVASTGLLTKPAGSIDPPVPSLWTVTPYQSSPPGVEFEKVSTHRRGKPPGEFRARGKRRV